MTPNDTHADRLLAPGALSGRHLGLCRGLIDGVEITFTSMDDSTTMTVQF
jgi:hypothetical protein